MSTFSHLVKRARHYLDPRTQIKAAVHVTQRAAYYSNPRTQIRAAERAAHFTERQARKDYIKFNRVTAFIAPVVTPILAFVAELVPGFGLVLGPIIAFAGAVIARLSDSVALRSQGVTGHANSQRARGKQNRTLKYGLYGSAAGGLASAAGLSLSSAATAAPSASAAPSAPGSGILGTGITWGNVGSVLSPVISLAPTVLKYFGIGVPKPAEQAPPAGSYGVGSGGSGAEGTGNVGAEGPLGELANNLAGLPLPIKLGAAAVGLGVVVMAFTKGKS